VTRLLICLLAVAMYVAWACFYLIPYARTELFSPEHMAQAFRALFYR
jgi:hypothetical protein